jgi:hypothetical protein
MKVKIGPYLNWYGPYQITDYIFFWTKRHQSDDEDMRWDYRLKDKFSDWLADTWFGTFCNWIHEKRKRTISVKIEPYDTWSMDHTLSLIIHPMLVQLRDTKHGAPFTDDEDVPEHLRSTNAPPKKEEWDTDDLFFDRWNWILDEMIWAFYQEANDDPDAPPFPELGRSIVKKMDQEGFTDMLVPPDDEQGNWEKYRADSLVFENRKQNAFKLFGKYYRSLWD